MNMAMTGGTYGSIILIVQQEATSWISRCAAAFAFHASPFHLYYRQHPMRRAKKRAWVGGLDKPFRATVYIWFVSCRREKKLGIVFFIDPWKYFRFFSMILRSSIFPSRRYRTKKRSAKIALFNNIRRLSVIFFCGHFSPLRPFGAGVSLLIFMIRSQAGVLFARSHDDIISSTIDSSTVVL